MSQDTTDPEQPKTYAVAVELTRDGADAWIARTNIIGVPGTDDTFDFGGFTDETLAYSAAASVATARWMERTGVSTLDVVMDVNDLGDVTEITEQSPAGPTYRVTNLKSHT